MNRQIKLTARIALFRRGEGTGLYVTARLAGIIFFCLFGFMANRLVTALVPAAFAPYVLGGATVLGGVWALLFFSLTQLWGNLTFVQRAVPVTGGAKMSFSLFCRQVRLQFVVCVLRLLHFAGWMLLPGAGSMGLWLLLQKHSLDRGVTAVLFAGVGALFLLGFLFYALCAQAFLCAPLLLAQRGDLTVKQALTLSKEKMQGAQGALLRFRLGFLPWFLLCIFVFPAFFVFPYYRQSLACYILKE